MSAFNWAEGEETRSTPLPVRHPDIWAFRKKIEALQWTAQEVDLSRDMACWKNVMTEEQRKYIKMQLAFFATIDVTVLSCISDVLAGAVDCMEARMYYAGQANQECVHAEAYGLQIDAVLEGSERDAAINAVKTMPVIAAIRSWVNQWFQPGRPADGAADRKLLGERLIAFAAVEGVMFSSSFAALQWLRDLNLLPGITSYNDFIARDEGVHAHFTCHLIKERLIERPAKEVAYAILGGCVDTVEAFVTESLPVQLIGMSAATMILYVKYQADCLLKAMGYPPYYGVGENPLPSMDKLSLNGVAKTNFFEERPSQYQTPVAEGAYDLRLDDTPVDEQF
jgi:ribonucleoside-diphosphate reductase subunit M2